MNSAITIIGLPLKTALIVGGLFILSALAPSILAVLLRYKQVWRDE
ncbi:hypothetical protein Amet_2981 [Alkaliphilus metalliredigens QYMF]|uniref:Uncharacterized protein n=1 Tax=Alkaliphilus metalliredigens (strain QYMF) TaxID=293826 RepID=A6TSG2_ALKMQ|nr:hypothetical protein [Alkaliphilus metalliredigens]ABR49130.1 hypothetical protein Amet_2981 [Alkaliphilus metalliredigens QYMF]